MALRTSCPYFSGFVTEPSILSLYTSTKQCRLEKQKEKYITIYAAEMNSRKETLENVSVEL